MCEVGCVLVLSDGLEAERRAGDRLGTLSPFLWMNNSQKEAGVGVTSSFVDWKGEIKKQ
jgi:hypothetical protein